MSYGTSLGITLPTVSVTAGPDYATDINSALTTIINTLEAKVTPSGMDISDDLSFKSGATYSAALNMERATFENKSSALSAATFPTALYLVNGELYFNDNAGNQVQVTSGGAVNVSTTGGITGSGYGSSDVEVNWDAGNVKYRMRSGSGTDDYASVHLNDVLLNDGSGNTLTLAAPSMSSDYTVTFPSAAPGSDSVVQMDSSGTLSASTTLPSITITANGDVTVSGTGEYKHGDRTLLLPALGQAVNESNISSNDGYSSLGTSGVLVLNIPLTVGDRIKSLTVRAYSTGATTDLITELKNSVDATESDISTDTTTLASGWQDVTISSINHTLVASKKYYVRLAGSGGGSSLRIDRVEVVYDRP